MKICIIGAMQMEVDNLKEAMVNQATEVVSGVSFVSGNIGDVEVVAAVCRQSLCCHLCRGYDIKI